MKLHHYYNFVFVSTVIFCGLSPTIAIADHDYRKQRHEERQARIEEVFEDRKQGWEKRREANKTRRDVQQHWSKKQGEGQAYRKTERPTSYKQQKAYYERHFSDRKRHHF
ncbi:hypothetical protein OAO01_05665 [Oligoflexia bacterium]|nr:hypothetical protein [Oligoflexia bacterium]